MKAGYFFAYFSGMNFKLLILLLALFASGITFSQLKKVKIKGDKSVRYYYHPDSTCLDKKETILLVRDFHQFFKVVASDNYEGYLQTLSPVTLKEIRPDKLERKFKKFKGYAVKLLGKISVRSIKRASVKCDEVNPFYKCVMKLPEGQSINRRVGFDPLKRDTFDLVEQHIALYLTATKSGYKVVIPW